MATMISPMIFPTLIFPVILPAQAVQSYSRNPQVRLRGAAR